MRSKTMTTYLPAAVLVRSMDAGATVGMVLLCTEAQIHSPLRTAGLLGAALTAPHVLGFLGAPLLDRARDGRLVIGGSAALFATLLALATWGVGTMPLPVVLTLCLGAGAAGPMLTGGLSSLVHASRGDEPARRRRGLDALTYGLAGAAAPALVATLAALLSPRGALLALCALGIVGGGLVLGIPRTPAREDSTDESTEVSPSGVGRAAQLVTRGGHRAAPSTGLRSGLSAIWREPRLRLVAILTWLAASIVAAALLAGMSMGERIAAGRGGWVAAAFGVGGLVGGLLLTARPLRTDPARGMLVWVGLVVPVLGAGALSGQSFPALLVVFAVLGLVVAPQTVLSLSARGEYSPAEARGTVFVTVAGTKVAFSSAGTAAAGLGAGLAPALVLATLGAVTVAAVATALLASPAASARSLARD